jgi:hypothetical protein
MCDNFVVNPRDSPLNSHALHLYVQVPAIVLNIICPAHVSQVSSEDTGPAHWHFYNCMICAKTVKDIVVVDSAVVALIPPFPDFAGPTRERSTLLDSDKGTKRDDI